REERRERERRGRGERAADLPRHRAVRHDRPAQVALREGLQLASVLGGQRAVEAELVLQRGDGRGRGVSTQPRPGRLAWDGEREPPRREETTRGVEEQEVRGRRRG